MKRYIVLLLILLIPAVSAHAQAPGDCMIDAVLLIDTGGSESVESMEKVKSFAAAVVGNLPMGGVRIGVIGFGQTAQTHLGLSGDGGAVMGAIGGLGVTGDAADFRVALEAGAALLNDARGDVSRAVVLITDGISATTATRRAQTLRSQNIAILDVGIGNGVNARELFNLASSSYYYYGSSNTILQPDIDRLGESISQVTARLCAASAIIGGSVEARTRDDRGYPITLPVSGATVLLLTTDNQTLRSTVTDNNGRYRFYVAPGTYVMQVLLPPGAQFAPSNNGIIPPVTARLGVASTRADTLMEINY